MRNKRDYEKELGAKLDEWQTKIEELKTKASNVQALNQLEFERQMDLLDAKHNLAQERLSRLRRALGVEWDELKASLDGIRNEIENALDSASAKIEQFL